jgi:hypothetical protein
MPITLDVQVEDLAREYPESVGFLTRNAVRCIRCGEPVWGSLGDLLKEDGVEDSTKLLSAMNSFLSSKE